MKKSILMLFFFLPLFAYSQVEKPIKKGNFILGGSGSVGNLDIALSGGKGFSINVNPTCDYFFIDNLAAGVTALIGYGKHYGSVTTSFGVGPNIKYYLDNGVFFRTDLYASNAKNDFSDSRNLTFKIGLGYAIFINSKVSFESSLMVNHNSERLTIHERDYSNGTIWDYKIKGTQNDLVLEFGFNIFL